MKTNKKIFAILFAFFVISMMLFVTCLASYSPALVNDNAIRTTQPQGIRFTAEIDKSLVEDEKLEEYGFILASMENLVDGGYYTASILTHEIDVNYLTAVNYGIVNGEKVDINRGGFEGKIRFSCVVANIDQDYYSSGIVARAYSKYDGEYYYSNAMSTDYISAAKSVKNSEIYASLNVTAKALVDFILSFDTDDVPDDGDDGEDVLTRDYEKELDELLKKPKELSQSIIIPTNIRNAQTSHDRELDIDVCYIYAYVDDLLMYIPLCPDSENAEMFEENSLTLSDEYAEQLCAYVIDEDGFYHIRSLAGEGGIEKEDESALYSDDENAMFYVNVSEDCGILKIRDNVYSLEDYTVSETVTANENTLFVVRYYDADFNDYEYVCYTYDSFADSYLSVSSIKYVVSNDVSSYENENLVILYAMAEKTPEISDKNTMIVLGCDIGQDENGMWRNYYEVLNPYTSRKEYDIPSVTADESIKLVAKKSVEKATLVKLTNEGLVDDSVEFGDNELIQSYRTVWITEAYEDCIAVVPVDEELCCDACIAEYVENYNGGFIDINDVRISEHDVLLSKEIPVTMIKTNSDNHFNYPTVAKADINDIINRKKNLLCYNDKALDKDGNYVTKYAKYVKAYVSTTETKNGDTISDYIIVVVHDDDNTAKTTPCEKHAPRLYIVSEYDVGKDDDGYYRYYYSLYDIREAKKVKDLGEVMEYGTIITSDAMSVDESQIEGVVDRANLVYIGNVKDDGTLVTAPCDEEETCFSCQLMKMFGYTSQSKGFYDILGNHVDMNFVPTDENTRVVKLENSRYTDRFFADATLSSSTLALVSKKDKSLRCYNDNALKSDGTYYTRYMNLVKAYIIMGDNDVAETIVVVVHGDDIPALMNSCEKDDGYISSIPQSWK